MIAAVGAVVALLALVAIAVVFRARKPAPIAPSLVALGRSEPGPPKSERPPASLRLASSPPSRPPPSASMPPASLDDLPQLPSVVTPEELEPEATQMGTIPSLAREDDEDEEEREVPSVASVPIEIDDDDLDDETGPTALILVTATARTDRGLVRKNNEDSLLAIPAHNVFGVADGMGGYAGGEVASKLAVDTMSEAFLSGEFPGLRKRTPFRRANELVRSIELANDAILTEATGNKEHRDMGTTIVAARFSAGRRRVYVANVGDSRAYRLRAGKLEQLTRDHTLELEMGLKGRMGEKLSRAVGVKARVKTDIRIEDAKPGDLFLMCSDGLTKMVPDNQVRVCMLTPDLEKAAQKLIIAANEHGGKDNVSVILIRVDEARGLVTMKPAT